MSPPGAASTSTSALSDFRDVLQGRLFRRLFGIRLVSQFADGVYQVGLASFIFFNPQQHTTAGAVAAAFAVLLLPFSVIAPFAGVLIDRWSRRQVLLISALVKTALAVVTAGFIALGSDGVGFLIAALCLLSVNRFFLSGLSAALPHTVARERLVMANAVTPTCGTFASFLGAGTGAVLRLAGGEGPGGTTVILLGAAAGFAASTLVSTTVRRREFGPDLDAEPAEVRTAVRNVITGMVAGSRHIWRSRPALSALATIGGHRFLYGISTIVTLLLYNNTFTSGGVAGLAGFSIVLALSGVGYFLGAIATPWVSARIGTAGWVALLLGFGAVALLVFGLPYAEPLFPLAGFALGIVSQGVKVSVDTTVQRSVDDVYLGRVFSVYDVLFNATFTVAAGVAALVVPASGVSRGVIAAMAAGYGLMCAGWLVRARTGTRQRAVARSG